MKNKLAFVFLLFFLFSCKKIQEKVDELVSETTQKAKQKAQETIQESVKEQLNKLANSGNVKFDSVFPHEKNLVIENEIGKKIDFPNGTPFYIFKYKISDKNLLLKTLVEEPTNNEAKSLKEFQKIDGAMIVEKISFFEKFLPKNTIDISFFEDIKKDKNMEYYKIKRFPNSTTIIYNPKNQMIYQLVEVKN